MVGEVRQTRMSEAGKRWRAGWFGCGLSLGVLACSSSQQGPGGLAAASGGIGGASGVAGNPAERAGAANSGTGGAPGAGGGRSGSTVGNPSGNCPPWSVSKLFPIIGPFFYGPDPGPCRTSDGRTTFSYAAGRVQSDTDSMLKLTETFTWQADQLSSSTGTGADANYTYSPGTVVIVTTQANSPPGMQSYHLDSAGYPLSASIGTGSSQRWLKYDYVGCRLDRRYETDASGNELNVAQDSAINFTYDAIGHVLARNGEQYDYGCWQPTSGGAGGTSGTSDAGTGGNAPDSTVGCPPWPANKLAPFIGSLFFGPDPGPCTWSDGNMSRTFAYSGGLLKSITGSDGSSEILNWDGERLVSSVETTATGATHTTQYGYASDSLTVTTVNAMYTSTTTYRLSPTGYPLSREYVYWVTADPGARSPLQTTSYPYDNCRLSGNYSYDAAGHLISLIPTNGNRLIAYSSGAPDYSCWKR